MAVQLVEALASTAVESREALDLESAALEPANAFATAAQGAKADTALQPSSLGVANGVAQLDSAGKMPSGNMPSTDAISEGAANKYYTDARAAAVQSALDLKQDKSTLTEAVQDIVGATIVGGANISINYNDAANTLTISASGTVSSAASDVSFSPAGGISATNAQAALSELDAEKVAKSTISVSDWNNATENGYYLSFAGAANAPNSTNVFFGHVVRFDANTIRQTLYREGNILSKQERQVYYNGSSTSWGAWVEIQDANGNNPRAPLLAASNTFVGDQNVNGRLLTNGDYGEVRITSANGQNAVRLYNASNGTSQLSTFISLSNDGFGANFWNPLEFDPAILTTKVQGDLTATGSLKVNTLRYNRAHNLANSTDLNGVTVPGFYDVYTPVNAPYSGVEWGYLEVQSSSSEPAQYSYQRFTQFFAGSPATWHRRRNSAGWSSWMPVSGFATPEHFGAIGSTTTGSVPDSTAALSRWLNSDAPIFLDQYYKCISPVTADITGKNGIALSGNGARSGIVLDGGGSAYVTFTGANQDNPTGYNTDQYKLSDITIYNNQVMTDQSPLSFFAADGDSGSSEPGIDLVNVNVVPTSTSYGSNYSQIRTHNIRQGSFRNCSVMGKYGLYQGAGFLDTCGDNAAPVERSFDNCRSAHVGQGFQIAPFGSTAYDDMQGFHYSGCTALAVNRGWDINGGPEGFGEWFKLFGCHAYFREIGAFFSNAGNLKVNNSYFLAHGDLATCQGVVAQGISIEPWVDISHNTIRMQAATGGTRIGINTQGSMTGIRDKNRITGATTPVLDGGGAMVGTNY